MYVSIWKTAQTGHHSEQLTKTFFIAALAFHEGTPVVHRKSEKDKGDFTLPHFVRQRRVYTDKRKLQGAVYGVYP